VQVFIDRTRVEQAEGNARLAAALEDARRMDLRSRLAELAELARGHALHHEHEHEQPDAAPAPEPAFEHHELGEHPHGLGRLEGAAPASANQDTGW
jgi:hypothetical protein